MLKPLNTNNLEKKYSELKLPGEKLDTLHLFFSAFANLYGSIHVKDAWEIFKIYKGSKYIRKTDFVKFAGVVQRDGKVPYYVVDVDEIYSEEMPDPEWRMIIHKSLVGHGYGRFFRVYDLVEKALEHSPYIPDEDTFLSFADDRFYNTVQGEKLSGFVCGLKSCGKGYTYKGEYEIIDVNGNPVKGKRLDEIIVYTPFEKSDISYHKKECDKKYYEEKYHITASEKILNSIRRSILEGNDYYFATPFEPIIDELNKNFGVSMSESEWEKFIELYLKLHNSSNMWCMFGWAPDELAKKTNLTMPSAINIGPNMKKAAKEGELDLEELKKAFQERGFDIIT